MKFIKISTDGGYLDGENVGAISFVVVDNKGNLITEFAQLIEKDVVNDNNIMETKAIIKALSWVISNGYSPKEYRVYLYTDSQNVQLSICEYFEKWKNNKWKSSLGKKVKNIELWKELYKYHSKFDSIYVQWIPKEDGYIWNVAADELCNSVLNQCKVARLERK